MTSRLLSVQTTPSSAAYNALPEIYDVDQGLVDNMVQKLEPLFARHPKVRRCWGIALKHRHWLVGDNEFAGEFMREIDGGVREYVLQPVSRTQDDYVPCKLQCTQSGLEALEFANTAHARESYGLLVRDQAFLRAFNDIMQETGLADTFALRYVREIQRGGFFMEITPSGVESITTELLGAEIGDSPMFRAFWSFEREGAGYCGKYCQGGCARQDDEFSGTHAPALVRLQ
jgi:hypothetical protein